MGVGAVSRVSAIAPGRIRLAQRSNRAEKLDQLGVEAAGRLVLDPGVGRAQPFTLSQGFPTGSVSLVPDPVALYNAATVAQPLAVSSVSYDPKDNMPYSLQWNFNIQRQVGFSTVVEAGYVASRGVNLERTVAGNNPGLERAQDVVIGRVPIQQVRPFPRIGGFNIVHYDTTSSFHSLQMKASRRFSSGFSLDANYTFSKNLDTASGIDESWQIPWQYFSIEKSLSSMDRTHSFSVGAVYELPFGKWVRKNSILSAILGGFQTNGLFTAGTGMPLTITQNNLNTVLSAQRPDVINSDRLDGRVDDPFFAGPARRWLIASNSADFPFRPASNVGIGNLGRNTSRSPSFSNLNLSIFRKFRIFERLTAELRAEAFNALNTVNWDAPSTNTNSATYGLILSAADPRQVQIGLRLAF